MHNPNPFSFVPFKTKPFLYANEEYLQNEKLYTGYLEVRIKALTPIHSVGKKVARTNDEMSYMFSEDGVPIIPASSIRGCLRAFIEALTNGWVSQANTFYEKSRGDRHLEFKLFEGSKENLPALGSAFKPSLKSGKLDIASFLFGLVVEKGESKQEENVLAKKSKIMIEDAIFTSQSLSTENQYWIPNIEGDSFMGGPHPSKSSWWYFEAGKVNPRDVKIRNRHGEVIRNIRTAEFYGSTFQGRKFYFHQDPQECVKYYDAASNTWQYSERAQFQKTWIQCVDQGKMSEPFRIYVHKIPKSLLIVLVLSLFPGKHIRHKLGYGKAYGYGSCEFIFEKAQLREEHLQGGIPEQLREFNDQILEWQKLAWDKENLEICFEKHKDGVIDWDALDSLAQILGYDKNCTILFTYPPFNQQNFQSVLQWDDFIARYKTLPKGAKSKDIAELFFSTKKTIHFEYYQEKAEGWEQIQSRVPGILGKED